ncbi:MAG: ABC transporter ATP-binding protein [Candidatus Schekmanbacteria bacterium]|nr:ABC transporter ATP-binding protein [Candidatus Schekmanbacteria bacterium]
MTAPSSAGQGSGDGRIVFENVSKFYGEVLGVNRVDLSIPPGTTGLVGPNGAGKTTIMNLMTGLLRPSQGAIRTLGIPPERPDELFRVVGYCTQFDSFPPGVTGLEFLLRYLRLHGHGRAVAERLAWQALERVGLADAAARRVAGYSKGMRQRVKLANAIAHDPRVLLLDEPLNGLDPLARADAIALFRSLAAEGRHLLISSHILHELDQIADFVVILDGGYVVAEGDVHALRTEIATEPLRILIRCDRPEAVAAEAFARRDIVAAEITADRSAVIVSTAEVDAFYQHLNRMVLEQRVAIAAVEPMDDDVHALYSYVVRSERYV